MNFSQQRDESEKIVWKMRWVSVWSSDSNRISFIENKLPFIVLLLWFYWTTNYKGWTTDCSKKVEEGPVCTTNRRMARKFKCRKISLAFSHPPPCTFVLTFLMTLNSALCSFTLALGRIGKFIFNLLQFYARQFLQRFSAVRHKASRIYDGNTQIVRVCANSPHMDRDGRDIFVSEWSALLCLTLRDIKHKFSVFPFIVAHLDPFSSSDIYVVWWSSRVNVFNNE